MENNPEGEISEMVDLYMEKGVSKEDATTIITTMAKYKDFFVDHMMVSVNIRRARLAPIACLVDLSPGAEAATASDGAA